MPHDPEDIRVSFQQIDFPGREPGICWMASLHPTDDWPPYALALAWVSVYPDGAGIGPFLDYILVPDHLRRHGYALRLIEECQRRWPDLNLTDPMSPAGEGLVRKLEQTTHRSI